MVITDLVLPDGNCPDVTKPLFAGEPPVIVAMHREDAEAVTPLDMVVADNLVRTRMQAQSHLPGPAAEVLVVGELRLDVKQCLLSVEQKQVRLSRKEGQVLALLMRHPGRMVSYDELTERIWDGVGVGSNVLAVYISRIRRKLRAEGAAAYLVTVQGVGQVMREPTGGTAEPETPAEPRE